jgi:very-short-patch-repair endonuclease
VGDGDGRGGLYHKRTSPKIFQRARESRHEPTTAEAKLWAYLRAHRFAEVHFRRQHAIGPYSVDFAAPRCKLIIEVDGSQHLDQEEYDAERTAFLEAKGYHVVRFWNGDVMNKTEEVMGIMLEELEKYASLENQTTINHAHPQRST